MNLEGLDQRRAAAPGRDGEDAYRETLDERRGHARRPRLWARLTQLLLGVIQAIEAISKTRVSVAVGRQPSTRQNSRGDIGDTLVVP